MGSNTELMDKAIRKFIHRNLDTALIIQAEVFKNGLQKEPRTNKPNLVRLSFNLARVILKLAGG